MIHRQVLIQCEDSHTPFVLNSRQWRLLVFTWHGDTSNCKPISKFKSCKFTSFQEFNVNFYMFKMFQSLCGEGMWYLMTLKFMFIFIFVCNWSNVSKICYQVKHFEQIFFSYNRQRFLHLSIYWNLLYRHF